MLERCLILLLFAFITSCATRVVNEKTFVFVKNEAGVELREHGNRVFFYQQSPLFAGENESVNPDNRFNHYLHPLYNLSGEVITEVNPVEDRWHPHHRGVFWAWHQILVAGQEVGDSWVMDDFKFDIIDIDNRIVEGNALVELKVNWVSTSGGNDKPIVSEHTTITTYPRQGDMRVIDFEISMKALLPGVEIGGSRDTIKAYSGFSTRIILEDSMRFLAKGGLVKPITGQVHAGAWVDFSTPLLIGPDKYGLTIMCHPAVPNFPSPWLLRSKNSMQNPAFPGFDLASISMKDAIVLRYRIIIHEGNATQSDIGKWYKKYVDQ